jgi:hypothetical protein
MCGEGIAGIQKTLQTSAQKYPALDGIGHAQIVVDPVYDEDAKKILPISENLTYIKGDVKITYSEAPYSKERAFVSVPKGGIWVQIFVCDEDVSLPTGAMQTFELGVKAEGHGLVIRYNLRENPESKELEATVDKIMSAGAEQLIKDLSTLKN